MHCLTKVGFVAALAFVASLATAAEVPRSYIVVLKAPPVAAYKGGVAGLTATRAAPGSRLDVTQAPAANYASYLRGRRAAVLSGAPGARVLHEYAYALNGMALVMTEAQARAMKANPDVESVTVDDARKLLTNRTPAFLGLTAPKGLWSQLDPTGLPVKGENMVIGMVDSGIWPEDPSFSDRVDASGTPVVGANAGTLAYAAPPPKWAGRCEVGPGFSAGNCNNKLIGARTFHARFDQAGGQMDALDFASARDSAGHGSHTASIAAGNANVPAVVNGVLTGRISGMAPSARIAVYKVCWTNTSNENACLSSDSIAAIDRAVADGVDVINFSISGTSTDLNDPVEQAFLNAAEAGVFVAAAAGNAGGNTVNHPSPWVTTVAASTTDKNFLAPLSLGNGASFRAPSLSSSGARGPLILATAASRKPPYDDTNILTRLCAKNSLDPAKVAGKIVVCDRGTTGRTDKSAEVARAGGVGMVLVNVIASTDDAQADAHAVPTVHLPLSARAAVRNYAATDGAVASIGVAVQTAGLIAPVITPFSSRGPNLADSSVLKPDVAAPGANILAALLTAYSPAVHDAIAAGTQAGTPNAATEQGTSMASPHVAGVALLLRQLRPQLSPAAIRSILTTSASGVKLPDGSADVDRFGYGAGQINPNVAATTDLVFDAGKADYQAYLCGLGLLARSSSVCVTGGSIKGKDLNAASISAEVVGVTTVKRRISNVGQTPVHYAFSSSLPGFKVSATPSTVSLAPGTSTDVSLRISLNGAAIGDWTQGAVTWSDGNKRVSSPVAVRGSLLSAPSLLSESTASGSASIAIGVGFDGALVVKSTGLATAMRIKGGLSGHALSCYPVTVRDKATVLRLQLFDSETANPGYDDLGMYVLDPSGSYLDGSDHLGSNEMVDIAAPPPGVYQACVYSNVAKNDATTFVVNAFVVAPSTVNGGLRVSVPTVAVSGSEVSGVVAWNGAAGQRSLGTIQFSTGDGKVLGTTLVSIDPVSIGKPAMVFRTTSALH